MTDKKTVLQLTFDLLTEKWVARLGDWQEPEWEVRPTGYDPVRDQAQFGGWPTQVHEMRPEKKH